MGERRLDEDLGRVEHTLRAILHILEKQERLLRILVKEGAPPVLQSSGATVTTLKA
jgi:hypothetical protein